MASSYATSYLVPISFWSRSGCWPCLEFCIWSRFSGVYLVLESFNRSAAWMLLPCSIENAVAHMKETWTEAVNFPLFFSAILAILCRVFIFSPCMWGLAVPGICLKKKETILSPEESLCRSRFINHTAVIWLVSGRRHQLANHTLRFGLDAPHTHTLPINVLPSLTPSIGVCAEELAP